MSTINGVISLSSFSPPRYFSPRRSYHRVPKFCMGLFVKKIKIWGKTKFGGYILCFFRKKLKVLRIALNGKKIDRPLAQIHFRPIDTSGHYSINSFLKFSNTDFSNIALPNYHHFHLCLTYHVICIIQGT